jgi:hypothetical protein
MKSTKTFILALALGAATFLGGLSPAAASAPAEKTRPVITCETNTAVRLLNVPRSGGEHTVTLSEGTRVLVRARANGYWLVFSRAGRGWSPREAITCTRK